MPHQPRRDQGIRVRHLRACGSAVAGKCSCKPLYEAELYVRRDKRKIRKSFPTLAAAKLWRADAAGAVRKGKLRAPKPTTLREAWEAWIAGARAGTVRTRAGQPYKPSA